jgi:hypothetical protein
MDKVVEGRSEHCAPRLGVWKMAIKAVLDDPLHIRDAEIADGVFIGHGIISLFRR